MATRVRGVVATKENLVRAYQNIYSLANWEFAKNREMEISKKLDGTKIAMTYGVLTLKSSHYEQEIIERLKKGKCRRRDKRAMRKCISSFIKRHRVPDIDLEVRGVINGRKVFRLTFIELGVSDRYYYKRKAVVKNSPAGIVLDTLKGRKTGKVIPVESDLVFDSEMAGEYIKALKSAGVFNVKNYLPRRSTMPRVEYDKIEHFLKPIPDLKKRVAGRVPVYFGYAFSDGVTLFMSFAEMLNTGNVQSEEVISFGRKMRSKNIVIEARNMKPVELLVIERLFGVIVNVTDTNGKAEIGRRKNSYRVNWVAKPDWRTGKIIRRVNVNARPKNLEEVYLLVKSAVQRL